MNIERKEKLKRVDGKQIYHFDDASDSLVETLILADNDNYPNIGKMFEIASVCHYLDRWRQK